MKYIIQNAETSSWHHGTMATMLNGCYNPLKQTYLKMQYENYFNNINTN